MNNAQDIIRYAMGMEQRAQEFYEFYKDKVTSRKIKELFEGLAEMEHEHYAILERQLKSLEANNTFEEFSLEISEGEDIIQSKTKDMEHVDLEYDLSDLPILRMAYAMENDFAIFYEKALEKATDPIAKNLLETLAKWEREHRDSFQSEVELATQNSWFSQGFYPF